MKPSSRNKVVQAIVRFINTYTPPVSHIKIKLEKVEEKEPQDMDPNDMAVLQFRLECDLERFINWIDLYQTKKPNERPMGAGELDIDIVFGIYILQ